MPDWPTTLLNPANGVIHPFGPTTGTGQVLFPNANGAAGSSVWPVANTAIYIPFYVETTVTAYQMSVRVAIQSGNLDAAIYDVLGNRLVAMGSTAVTTGGNLQLLNITDTVLTPGTYFAAMNCDNGTASFLAAPTTTIDVQTLRSCGVQQQAVGAVTLPDPATFAAVTTPYLPVIVVHTQATA